MGMDLMNQNEEWHYLTIADFRNALQLAQTAGWEPMGTLHEADEWDGNYSTNDGQIIMEEDLAALADALEKMLTFPPETLLNLSEDRAVFQELLKFCRNSEYLVIH